MLVVMVVFNIVHPKEVQDLLLRAKGSDSDVGLDTVSNGHTRVSSHV